MTKILHDENISVRDLRPGRYETFFGETFTILKVAKTNPHNREITWIRDGDKEPYTGSYPERDSWEVRSIVHVIPEATHFIL